MAVLELPAAYFACSCFNRMSSVVASSWISLRERGTDRVEIGDQIVKRPDTVLLGNRRRPARVHAPRA